MLSDLFNFAKQLAQNVGDFFNRPELPDAPPTTPQGSEPPPFTGGQCGVYYRIIVKTTRPDNTIGYINIAYAAYAGVLPNAGDPLLEASQNIFLGAISDIALSSANGIIEWSVTCASGVVTGAWGEGTLGLSVHSVSRVDNEGDTCGDPPSSTPDGDIPNDGTAQSDPPEIIDDSPLVLGAPLVVIPPLGGAIAVLGAAALAAQAAGSALEMGKAIADFLKKLGEYADEQREKDKEEEKKKPKHKHLRRIDYGRIEKDGYINIAPNGVSETFQPLYIDIQILSIPIGYGKYFGEKSPNFYRFKSLGHIAFTSPTFGVMEVREIEFRRSSFNCPENCVSFFYHLGLDGSIAANVSLFYLETPLDEDIVEI